MIFWELAKQAFEKDSRYGYRWLVRKVKARQVGSAFIQVFPKEVFFARTRAEAILKFRIRRPDEKLYEILRPSSEREFLEDYVREIEDGIPEEKE